MQKRDLTSRERMQALLAKRPIDRIPVSISASLYAAKIAGISFKDFWTNPQKSFSALEETYKRHHCDDIPQHTYGWSDWAGWEFGGIIRIPETDSGYPEVVKRPVASPQDVETLKMPDLRKSPVLTQKIACARLNRQMGGRALIQVSPTGMVGSIVGNDKLLRWFFKEPDAVHALYRKVTDYILNVAQIYINEFGSENCSIFETLPLDSSNVIGPELFGKFGQKYFIEIHEKLLPTGIKSWHVHLCGNHTDNLACWKNIPLAKRTVFSIGSEMDIKETADSLGEDHIISGNVPTGLLQTGSPEDVMEASRQIIEKVKYHPGGFILRPACTLPPLTPPENVDAMVKAAMIFGKYH